MERLEKLPIELRQIVANYCPGPPLCWYSVLDSKEFVASKDSAIYRYLKAYKFRDGFVASVDEAGKPQSLGWEGRTVNR